jgi:hypothetical protein
MSRKKSAWDILREGEGGPLKRSGKGAETMDDPGQAREGGIFPFSRHDRLIDHPPGAPI